MKKTNLREIILHILQRIEKDSGFSHLLIQNEIKSNRLSEQDAGLLTEVVYGTIQYKLTLDYYLATYIKQNQKVDDWVQMLLRMSTYQMVFLDRIPDHAVIYEAVEIAKKKGHKGIASFVNGVLRNIQRKGVQSTAKIQNNIERIAIETSHPIWLIKRWVDQYGMKTTKEMCQANVMQKSLSIRIQPLRISRDEAMEQLTQLGFRVKSSMFSDQGIIIEKGNILFTELFKKGYVTIQDESSMLATSMLDVEQGMHVLDACSAPGGKTTHIAEQMGDVGEVHAYDLHQKKVSLVERKASDLQLSIIHPMQGDARKLQAKYENNSFDRILVDAPCSGLGVVRQKPDIKYQRNASDITQLSKVQLNILTSVAPLLKTGGKLIYSTCTVDQEENEHVVKHFLQCEHDFTFDEEFIHDLPKDLKESEGLGPYGIQLFPQQFQTDGFFIARLVKLA